MWDQLYPSLIACVEYIAYEFRKSFHLTSPHNNRWFTVLEKWNNRFSVVGQSLSAFIGFFHSSNNFALFWFHSICATELFSWSSFSIIDGANKKYFPPLVVTLHRQIPGSGQAGPVLTTGAWTFSLYASQSVLVIFSSCFSFFIQNTFFSFFSFSFVESLMSRIVRLFFYFDEFSFLWAPPPPLSPLPSF